MAPHAALNMYASITALSVASIVLASAAPPPSAFNVGWKAPSAGPGITEGGQPTYADAMPLGNGALTALAWANVSIGGASMYLGHQNAMSSWTELFRLAQVDVALSPSPFSAGPFFNQTLDLSTGTFMLYAGGTSMDDYAVLLTVWADANADVLYVDATSRVPTSTFSLIVTITSTRPAGVWSYLPPFATCAASVTSQPDVFVDPVPTTPALARKAHRTPQSAEDAIRHASGARHPLRQHFARGGEAVFGAFQPGSLISFHRNVDSDGLSMNLTLTQQGAASLIATTPEYWRDNTFGFALDGGAGPALTRSSPTVLTSSAPAAAFELRATLLAVQTDSVAEWLSDLAALVTLSKGAQNARPLHDAWWSSFWSRSYILVNTTTGTGYGAVPAATLPLPIPGAALWVKAGDLTLQNGSAVASWPDASGGGADLTQATAALQPHFVTDALGPGLPGVKFDGISSFLSNSKLNVTDSTIMAVFRDDGSSGGSNGSPCCSGIVFLQGSFRGLSTVPAGGQADDDDNHAAAGAPIVTMLDWAGSNTLGTLNVRGRIVTAAAEYSSSGSSLYVDGCLQATSSAMSAASSGIQVGTRNNELGRFFLGVIGEIVIFPRVLNTSERSAMHAYFQDAWPTMPIKKNCGTADSGFQLSQMYAITRYTQAIQSRGVLWPIKFNGMAFIAAMNNQNGAAESRSWGPSNWWQNTRLPYGAMLIAGDFDLMRVILDYYTNMEKLLGPRTQLYWGHDGMWTTETHTLYGSYDATDYGCSRPADYPVAYESSGYLHVDGGGDSGTGEYSLMAIDFYAYTGDASYLNLAFAAANFFMYHYPNRTDGRLVVWPAQVLETYWCDWSGTTWTNCCADDSPTISGMITLFEKLLLLPDTLTTPAQRAVWTNFTTNLIPLLPLTADGTQIAAGRVLNNGGHNDEGPEIFAMHPHRVFTKGREVASGQDLTIALATLAANGFARENSGWNYGLNAAALLGATDMAAEQLLVRAATRPAAGYRWPGFAPHFQDFDPSADHFANMNRALQEMLLQGGEDGFTSPTIVLFPAWPCSWDVATKLVGPLNTTVEIVYAAGALVSLVVDPPSRAGSVKWANCVA
jgi:hypothetical protein